MSHGIESPAALSPLKRALLALQDLRARLETVEAAKREPIAIIGAACRFPGGANDLLSFWQLLREGKDTISEVPKDRWDIDSFYDPDPQAAGKMSTRYGGFLEAVDQFDAPFFGISPREAVNMDPQQRLLLEVSWESLEHAGQSPQKLLGSRTGVFIGICSNDYLRFHLADLSHVDAYISTGNAHSVAAGRLSYTLGLQGPSMAVDTACSSSLVAVHLACQSLLNGECDMALAGGATVLLPHSRGYLFKEGEILSPDGHCRPFDARSAGTVFGSGTGCGRKPFPRCWL